MIHEALNILKTLEVKFSSHSTALNPPSTTRKLSFVFVIGLGIWNENSVPMGYYAASWGNFLPTFRDNPSVPSSGVKNPWPLKMGCPETSVRNYHYSLRNNPEERSVHPLPGGSLTSRIGICVVRTFIKALQKTLLNKKQRIISLTNFNAQFFIH